MFPHWLHSLHLFILVRIIQCIPSLCQIKNFLDSFWVLGKEVNGIGLGDNLET